MSSSSTCMSDARSFCRSWTTPHIVPGEAPNHSVQYCKALASTTVCFLLTSQMPLVPQNVHSGMKSHHLRLLRQGGAFHQPILSSWSAGNLKPAACFSVSSCTWALLSCPGPRDWSSGHQLGDSSFSARWAQTQSMGLPIRSGDAKCWVLAQPAAIGWFDGVVWDFGLGSSLGGARMLVITIMGSSQGTSGQGGRCTWSINPLIRGVSQEVGQVIG